MGATKINIQLKGSINYLFPGSFWENQFAALSNPDGGASSSAIYFKSSFFILSLSLEFMTNSSLPPRVNVSKTRRSLLNLLVNQNLLRLSQLFILSTTLTPLLVILYSMIPGSTVFKI